MNTFARAGAVALTAAAIAAGGPAGAPAGAQESPAALEQQFIAACHDAVARNNPIWTQERRDQICACRYRFAQADFTDGQMRLVIDIMAGRTSPLEAPMALNEATADHIQTCVADPAAAPE